MRIIYLGLLLFVFACSSNIESNWVCPLPQGEDCKTISQADSKKIEQDYEITDLEKQNLLDNKISQYPNRTSEKISRIWFAPFIDQADNYHDSSYVFFIEQYGNWLRKN